MIGVQKPKGLGRWLRAFRELRALCVDRAKIGGHSYEGKVSE